MTHKPASILLGSGKYFYYEEPERNPITIEDYAAGLAFQSRFQGQCVDRKTGKRVYYSIAQHCVIGSYQIKPKYAYEFLMHESGETVCGDMVRPLKQIVPEFEKIEKICEHAISKSFKVFHYNRQAVKEVDLRMWVTERKLLMNWDNQPWPGDGFGDNVSGPLKPFNIEIEPLGPYEAYDLFLNRWNELKP